MMHSNEEPVKSDFNILPAELFNPLNYYVTLLTPGDISTYRINKENSLKFFSNSPTAYTVQAVIESKLAIAIPYQSKKNKEEISGEEKNYWVIQPFDQFLNYHFQHHCLAYYFNMKKNNEGIQNLRKKVIALTQKYENKKTLEAIEGINKRDAINRFLDLIDQDKLSELISFLEEKGEDYTIMTNPRETGWKKKEISDTQTYLNRIEEEMTGFISSFKIINEKNPEFFIKYFKQEKENRLELK